MHIKYLKINVVGYHECAVLIGMVKPVNARRTTQNSQDAFQVLSWK